MKKFLLSMFCFSLMASFCVAQGMPEKIVEITKKGVNVRKEASATGAVVEKASLGKQYVFVSQQGAWFEIKNPETGVTAFVSNTVAVAGKPVAMAEFLKFDYVNQFTTKEYEKTYTYSIWADEKDKNAVGARYTDQYITMQGQVRTDEMSYKGKVKGWYIALDTQIDMMEEETKMESPMILYRSIARAGVYDEGGNFYKATEPSEF